MSTKEKLANTFNVFKAFFKKIYSLKASFRRIILICIDTTISQLTLLSVYLIFFFPISLTRFLSLYYSNFLLFLFLTPIVYYLSSYYSSITKYQSIKANYYLFLRNIILTIIVLIISIVLGLNLFPSNYLISFIFIQTLLVSYSRSIIKTILNMNLSSEFERKNYIVIYGAGEAGAQLALSLRSDKNNSIKFFIDDNSDKWGRFIYGIPIRSIKSLDGISKNHKILLALPKVTGEKRFKIIQQLLNYNFSIMEVPSLNDLTNGNAKIGDLKDIKIENLLYRDSVMPDKELIKNCIEGRVTLVTGAGGSIGSELCRQIIKFNPSKLLILDNSEYNLFKIQNELISSHSNNCNFQSYLGSVDNIPLIRKILKEENVDIVFHASAYKHVHLVEENPISGVINNILATKYLCDECQKARVKNFVLVSSDKAVRPTSIMGKTKRIAELIIQAKDLENNHNLEAENKTCFSMVRFGNVLDSSGSVVPIFREQIAKGGPVTVTDPEVHRYFMTIEEAAQLVLQTIPLSSGGDVFLLDMGKPIKILDLAKQMIRLSGNTIKNKDNKDGDIEIVFSGLKKGEKLYEELLIDGRDKRTKHPLIFTAKEKTVEPQLLWDKIKDLERTVSDCDISSTLYLIATLLKYSN